MKWLQNGNLAKLVAFFVIAVVITCTVSFAANGWQSFIYNDQDSDKITTENNSANNKVDENNNGNKDADIHVIQPGQKYFHPITGLQTDLESTIKRPLSFCIDTNGPLYGISTSYLTIELPTEYGNTRFLCFTDEATSLGKIGSLAPSRAYISNLTAYFGGVLLSYGCDDKFEYSANSPYSQLDFQAVSGYCYTEYNSFVYTNGDLVNAMINNLGVNRSNNEKVNLPYNFIAYQDRVYLAGYKADSISISFSSTSSTVLDYSIENGQYFLTKNGSIKKDLLNDRAISYDNVFILYANATTHETEDNTQLIIDTYTSGTGLYATMGTCIEITWHRDENGNLNFYNSSGEKLTVNRGSTYIAYVKASAKSSVQFS